MDGDADLTEVYYFGRGSSNCIAVTKCGGNYAKIFIGNGKTREAGPHVFFDLGQLDDLIEFFEALRDDTMREFIEKRLFQGAVPEQCIEHEQHF